jgi:Na+/H+ antiporter NhaC
MASAGAQCDHVDHVATQLPYALTVAAISAISYIIAGFIPNAYIALPAAFVILFATLFIIKGVVKNKQQADA